MKPERRLAKASQSNPVLQRSARSEVLHLEPVLHARPLNTALDGSEVIEVKRSAIDGESKKRQMWRSPLKRAKSNDLLGRRGEIEVKRSGADAESKKSLGGGVS
jgi:hypothetical protein